jgi:hypothetical protein
MQKAIITLFATSAFAAEKLIFSDNFDTFNMKKWSHELNMAGGGNNEFQVYRNNRTNSFVKNGVLYLQPTLTSESIGITYMKTGSYAMWGGTPADLCTSNAWYGCERNAADSG